MVPLALQRLQQAHQVIPKLRGHQVLMVLLVHQQHLLVQAVYHKPQVLQVQTVQAEHLLHQQVRQVRLKHRVQTVQTVQAVLPVPLQE